MIQAIKRLVTYALESTVAGITMHIRFTLLWLDAGWATPIDW